MVSSWVNGEGAKPADLMLVGESPGVQEDRTGRPFVGKSGRELTGYMTRQGVDREQVYITNLLKWRPPNDRDPKPDEIADAAPILLREIEEVNPKVIVTLGGHATRFFLPWVRDMEAVCGQPHPWKGRIILPCFHPAYGMRDTRFMKWIEEAFDRIRGLVIQAKTTPVVEDGDLLAGKEDYRSARFFKEIQRFVDKKWNGIMAVDTESDSLGNPYLASVSFEGGKSLVFNARDQRSMESLRKLLSGEYYTRILHNSLYDIPVLRKMSMKIGKFHDTMLMAFLLQTYPQSLKSLAYRLFRMEMEEYDDVVGDKAGLDEVEDFDRVVRYSARDADATMRVFPVLWKEICDRGLREVYERDLATIPMIVDMMANGVGADRYRLEHLQKYFTIQMAKLQEEIDRYAGKGYTKVINPNSTQQVSDILYRILGLGKGIKLKPLKNEKGFSTDANALAKIKGKHPIVEKITQYRAYGKLVNTYIEVLLEKVGEGKGRIHTNLRITRVPHSGRLSSSDPNLMAQPVRTEEGNMVRKCFVADPGYKLVSFDYDQIEMRVMAHVSQDPTMIKLFLDGRDIHAETAARIFGVPLDKVDDKKHRYPTKRAGFGIIYSIGPKGLSDVLVSSGAGENWTEDACRKLIDEYFTVYPGIRQYIRDTRTCAMRHGMVKDMWGRFKYTPEVKSTLPYIKEEGLRKACNMPIQSGSQGIIKQAMVNVHRTYGANPNVKPLLQIHDDLLFELKEELLVGIVPTIEAVMVEAATLSVPILVSVKVGDDWGNMKPYTGGE